MSFVPFVKAINVFDPKKRLLVHFRMVNGNLFISMPIHFVTDVAWTTPMPTKSPFSADDLLFQMHLKHF